MSRLLSALGMSGIGRRERESLICEELADFDSRRTALTNSLTMELTGIERAIALVGEELPEYLEIIRNIIYLGLPAKVASTIGSREDSMEN